ncbi:MAG: aspartyl protease family protein [Planctomycetota bacterium]
MAAPRCPSCLSFAEPGATRCRECGQPLSSGRPTLQLLGAALVLAGVLSGLGFLLFGPAREGTSRGPAAVVTAPGTSASHPQPGSDLPAPLASGTPPAHSLPALPVPREDVAAGELPPSPPFLWLELVDEGGLVLRSGVGVHLRGGNVLVWVGLVRGANAARSDTFGEAAFVSGLAGELVLLHFPRLRDAPPQGVAPAPAGGDHLRLVCGGPSRLRYMTVASGEQGRDRDTGEPCFLFEAAADFEEGSPLVTREGTLVGLVTGVSTEGLGMAIPVTAAEPFLAGNLAWSFEQLRLYVHQANARSRAELGGIYARLGRSDLALRELDAAVMLDPALADELRLPRAAVLRLEAARLMQNGAPGEARSHLERSLELRPDDVSARKDLAIVLLALGEPESAVAELRYAASLNGASEAEMRPLLIESYRRAGEAAVSRGEVPEAVRLLREGTALYPQEARLWLALGEALLAAEAWNEAFHAFQDAARLDASLAREAGEGMQRAQRALDGPVEIDFPRNATAVRTRALLNDRVEIDVIVDTGASMTVITRAVADRLGLRNLDRLPQIAVKTVGKSHLTAPLATLESVSLGEARVKNLEVLVVELEDWDETEGLIGLNFLNHFSFTLDHRAGRLILTPR